MKTTIQMTTVATMTTVITTPTSIWDTKKGEMKATRQTLIVTVAVEGEGSAELG